MAPPLFSVTPADGPACVVGDMRRNGLNCIGRHLDRLVNVLVFISQKDRLRKASYRIISGAQQSLIHSCTEQTR